MATFKALYTSGSALTVTLASLASSVADPPVGRESTVIDNSSNLYEDAYLFGQITTGTSPTTGKQILICVYGVGHNTATYYFPAGITGADAGLTPAFAGAVGPLGLLVPAVVIPTGSTSNITHKFGPVSVRSVLNLPLLPIKWGVFIYHNTGVALHATAGNHAIYWQGVQGQSA